MQITGLELTLRRIGSIESKFASLSQDNGVLSNLSKFDKVLNNEIDKKTSINEVKGTEKAIKSNISTENNKPEISALIDKYSSEHGLDKSLIEAVIKAESGYNTNAKSPVGAMGLMQLMPVTAKNMGVDNPFNAEQNIAGGTKYLKNLMDKYNGNKEFALAAYNAGPAAVNKYGGIPPYNETQNYVKKVLNYQQDFNGIAGVK